MYPRIPDPPAPQPDQTVEQYGLILFTFALSHGDASMSDQQVESALYAGTRLIAVPRGTYDDRAYASMVQAHRLLAATARRRAAELAPTTAAQHRPAASVYRDGIAADPSSPVANKPKPKTDPRGPNSDALIPDDDRVYARY